MGQLSPECEMAEGDVPCVICVGVDLLLFLQNLFIGLIASISCL